MASTSQAEGARPTPSPGDSVTVGVSALLELVHDSYWAGVHSSGHDRGDATREADFIARVDDALHRLGLTWVKAG